MWPTFLFSIWNIENYEEEKTPLEKSLEDDIGLIQVKEEGWTGFSEGWQGCSEGFSKAKPDGNPEEPPCQPEENPVNWDSFTWIYILFEREHFRDFANIDV